MVANHQECEETQLHPVSVLHLNTWGGIGGAFIASDRLHRALLNLRINSVLAYGRALKDSDRALKQFDHYQHLKSSGNWLDQKISFITQRLGLNDIGNLSSFSLQQETFFQQATVLNFHNLHSEYFSYLALPTLTRRKPAVWTLHDMWSFTGHCAYSFDCTKWQAGCGQCLYPEAMPAIRRDATHLEWRLKSWIYRRSNLTIVAPSRWLAAQAQQSFLSRHPIHYIPNGIDTETYRPLDRAECRSILGLPLDKFVLLFGAQLLGDRRKGGDLLLKALHCLPESLKANTLLLTMGETGGASENLGMKTVNLGYVGDDDKKAIVYSAADVFVFPTRADNLPLVLQESMACGTPMVSFEVGGVPDLVRPNITGYLAAPEDFQGLSQGIVDLLENSALRDRMRENCRTIALQEYRLEQQAQRYLELYQEIL